LREEGRHYCETREMIDTAKPYVWKAIKNIGVALVLALFVRTTVAEAFFVKGESMVPTLSDGDLLLVSKFVTPKIGVIVIVRHSLPGKSYAFGFGDARLVKRVVGIEDGKYIVMGDNREHSLDSRYFGPVEKSDIVGRVEAKLWSRL